MRTQAMRSIAAWNRHAGAAMRHRAVEQ